MFSPLSANQRQCLSLGQLYISQGSGKLEPWRPPGDRRHAFRELPCFVFLACQTLAKQSHPIVTMSNSAMSLSEENLGSAVFTESASWEQSFVCSLHVPRRLSISNHQVPIFVHLRGPGDTQYAVPRRRLESSWATSKGPLMPSC